MFKALQAEIQNILLMIDNQEMKEVKGIGDRLFGLDKLLSSAKKYVQEQTDLAQSFQQVRHYCTNVAISFLYSFFFRIKRGRVI